MRDAPLQKGESPLRICSLSKEEFQISKDAKFSPGIQVAILLKYQNTCKPRFLGIQVSCPYLYCNSKNSQFQNAGRFPSGIYFIILSLWWNVAGCSDIPNNLGSSSLLVNLGSAKISMKLITVTPSAFLSGRLHLFTDFELLTTIIYLPLREFQNLC